MPIEIKELKINISIDETNGKSQSFNKNDWAKELENMKSKIISECTEKVLKKIKQKSER